jgi:hypothetical protein
VNEKTTNSCMLLMERLTMEAEVAFSEKLGRNIVCAERPFHEMAGRPLTEAEVARCAPFLAGREFNIGPRKLRIRIGNRYFLIYEPTRYTPKEEIDG